MNLNCLHYINEIETCYEQLELMLANEKAEPEQIAELVFKSEQIFKQLTDEVKNLDLSEENLEKFQSLAVKLHQLMSKLTLEINKVNELILSLKKGKQVVTAYNTQPSVGMGFTEGKFIDRKN